MTGQACSSTEEDTLNDHTIHALQQLYNQQEIHGTNRCLSAALICFN